jgi:hypothetical protein
MAKSTGISLTATAISFGNEWVSSNTPNFRILIAGLGVTVIFAGIERLDENTAVGLSVLFLLAVLLTRINGKSPAETIVELLDPKSKTAKQNLEFQKLNTSMPLN